MFLVRLRWDNAPRAYYTPGDVKPCCGELLQHQSSGPFNVRQKRINGHFISMNVIWTETIFMSEKQRLDLRALVNFIMTAPVCFKLLIIAV